MKKIKKITSEMSWGRVWVSLLWAAIVVSDRPSYLRFARLAALPAFIVTAAIPSDVQSRNADSTDFRKRFNVFGTRTSCHFSVHAFLYRLSITKASLLPDYETSTARKAGFGFA